MIKRLLHLTAILLACMLFASSALAEVRFLPAAQEWMLEEMPLEISLQADVDVHMPFDEDRLGQLMAITDRMGLQLKWQPMEGETQSRVALMLDGEIILAMAQQQSESETLLQLSSQPDITYAAVQDPLGLLLGESAAFESLWGVDGTEHAWLEEGYALVMAFEEGLKPYLKEEKKVSTSIANMGKAAKLQDYTVAKDDAPGLTQLLVSLCPEGRLRTLLSSLVFSGKQTMRIYRTAEGVPLRVEYNGNCGPAQDKLRDVQLVWRLRRDDKAYRDEITLKSPALRGGDKNTIEYSCVITEAKKNKITLDASLSYTSVSNKVKTVLTAEADLTNTVSKDENRVTGDMSIKRKVDDADSVSITLKPDVTFSGDAEAPQLEGTVTLEEKLGSSVTEQAKITLSLRRGDYVSWNMRENTIDLSMLTETELAQVQQEAVEAVAGQVVREIIRALREDATYLFKDLPEETIRLLIDAADD